MLVLVDIAIDALSATGDLLEAVFDFRRWRNDWDRTWSPVSCLLALSALAGLAFLIWMYGAMAWAGVKAALP